MVCAWKLLPCKINHFTLIFATQAYIYKELQP
jgi:hypothetical protein